MKKIESVLFQGITENEWMHMLDLVQRLVMKEQSVW